VNLDEQHWNFGIAAIAKKPTINEPNIVLNELVCILLGRALFLPLPPGVLLDNNGETYFSSLNFNFAGQALPSAPVATIVAELPELSWGITLFDGYAWLKNQRKISGEGLSLKVRAATQATSHRAPARVSRCWAKNFLRMSTTALSGRLSRRGESRRSDCHEASSGCCLFVRVVLLSCRPSKHQRYCQCPRGGCEGDGSWGVDH
jgi:hypothetical protein